MHKLKKYFSGLLAVMLLVMPVMSLFGSSASAAGWGTADRQYMAISLYSPSSGEFETQILYEDEESVYGDGYDVLSDMMPQKMPYGYGVDSLKNKTVYDDWDGTYKITVKSANTIAEEEYYSLSYANVGSDNGIQYNADSGNSLTVFNEAWNGSTSGDDTIISSKRLSASEADRRQADEVSSFLTSELNSSMMFITYDDTEQIGSEDWFVDDIRVYNNNIVDAVGESTPQYGYFGPSDSCDPNGDNYSINDESKACYPYTVTDAATYKTTATSSQKSWVNSSIDEYYESNSDFFNNGTNSAVNESQFIVVERYDATADTSYTAQGEKVAEEQEPVNTEIYMFSAAKGYDEGEILHDALEQEMLLENEEAESISQLGVTYNYTWSSIMGMGLYAYEDNYDTTIKTAEDFSELQGDGQIDDTAINSFLGGNFIYSLGYWAFGIEPINELLSPYENGVTSGWVNYYIPYALDGVLFGIRTFAVILSLILLTWGILKNLSAILATEDDTKGSKELISHTVQSVIYVVGYIALFPFIINALILIQRLILNFIFIIATPDSYALGAYEVGANLGTDVVLFGWISAMAMFGTMTIWWGIIMFSYAQIWLFYCLSPLFALEMLGDNKMKILFSRIGQTAWLVIGKFAVHGLAYAILATLAYNGDLGLLTGPLALGIAVGATGVVEKLLGLKLTNIAEGAAYAGQAAMQGKQSLDKGLGYAKNTSQKVAGSAMDLNSEKARKDLEKAKQTMEDIKDPDSAAYKKAQTEASKQQNKIDSIGKAAEMGEVLGINAFTSKQNANKLDKDRNHLEPEDMPYSGDFKGSNTRGDVMSKAMDELVASDKEGKTTKAGLMKELGLEGGDKSDLNNLSGVELENAANTLADKYSENADLSTNQGRQKAQDYTNAMGNLIKGSHSTNEGAEKAMNNFNNKTAQSFGANKFGEVGLDDRGNKIPAIPSKHLTQEYTEGLSGSRSVETIDTAALKKLDDSGSLIKQNGTHGPYAKIADDTYLSSVNGRSVMSQTVDDSEENKGNFYETRAAAYKSIANGAQNASFHDEDSGDLISLAYLSGDLDFNTDNNTLSYSTNSARYGKDGEVIGGSLNADIVQVQNMNNQAKDSHISKLNGERRSARMKKEAEEAQDKK